MLTARFDQPIRKLRGLRFDMILTNVVTVRSC